MALGQHRSTQRKAPQGRDDEERLTADIVALARQRLWLTDGSCIRLRPEHRNHVWSYDFIDTACSM